MVALMGMNSSQAFTPSTFGVSRTANTKSIGSKTAFTPAASNNNMSLFMSAEEIPASKVVRKPDSAVEITLTAPGAATKAAYDKACAEISKTISIPGFRKGAKIPPAVIENAMGAKGGKNTLRTQAIQTLLSQLLEPALKEEHNLEPVGQPTLVTSADELAESFKPGDPIEMIIACDVWPDISWKEVDGEEKPYHGLKASYTRKPFDEARFNQAMKDLAERYAVTESAAEGKELAMGDSCVVDMKGYMAGEDGTSKAEPLPDAASGDDVEVILGDGRYMEGLVGGLLGAKVGDTKTIFVSFPEGLRDKTLAGKKAVFDVIVKEANIRTVPEIDDELANKIRPGLDEEGLKAELRKAVDEQDAQDWIDPRNKALAKALAGVMDVEVPDTLVTNQAREKYAQMMAEFRSQGMADDEIKKLITPENFMKYKDIQKPDIADDFKTSMASDEISRLEGLEVPAYQIDEQVEALKKEANGEDLGEESMLRAKIESTIMRRLVFDYLADHAELDVQYAEEEEFDEKMLEELAQLSMNRETDDVEGKATKTVAQAEETQNAPEKIPEPSAVEPLVDTAEGNNTSVSETKSESGANAEKNAKADDAARYGEMDIEDRAYNILIDLGMVEVTPDPESPDYDNSNDDDRAH